MYLFLMNQNREFNINRIIFYLFFKIYVKITFRKFYTFQIDINSQHRAF